MRNSINASSSGWTNDFNAYFLLVDDVDIVVVDVVVVLRGDDDDDDDDDNCKLVLVDLAVVSSSTIDDVFLVMNRLDNQLVEQLQSSSV